jgi:hypothetical protein
VSRGTHAGPATGRRVARCSASLSLWMTLSLCPSRKKLRLLWSRVQKALAANEYPSPRRIDRMALAAGLELAGSTITGWFETWAVVPSWDKFEVLIKALAAEHDEDWRALHRAALTADRERKRAQRRRKKLDRATMPVSFEPPVTDEVTVYTSNDEGEPLRDAVVEILTVCGFEIVAQAPAERGSWFQRLMARRRDSQAMEKLGELAGKVERAAELKYINALRSESDEREANAIARLAEAMSTMDEVVVRTSSVIFIKTGGRVLAWVLAEDEIRLLNDNPQLMRAPAELMDVLDRRAQAARDFPTTAIDAR